MNFPVVIIKKGSTFFAVIKELSLFEKGESLLEVYEKIELRKIAYFEQMKELPIELPRVGGSERKKPRLSLNWVVFSLFLMIPILSVINPLSALLSRSKTLIEKVTEMASTDFILKVSQKMAKMPAEEKAELREAIHLIAVEMEPYFKELSP